jgi:hypothetical protein
MELGLNLEDLNREKVLLLHEVNAIDNRKRLESLQKIKLKRVVEGMKIQNSSMLC